MSNAIAWARQYIAVPDAMYREYVEELLRMAERAESLESAVKLVDVIEAELGGVAELIVFAEDYRARAEKAETALKALRDGVGIAARLDKPASKSLAGKEELR